MSTRYKAEWIEKQSYGKDGEWQPDLDERTSQVFRNRNLAMKKAREFGKQYGWARVAKEEARNWSDALGSFELWDEVKIWTWDGFVWNEYSPEFAE